MTFGRRVFEEEVLASINTKGRDNARRPMQWDDTENTGLQLEHLGWH